MEIFLGVAFVVFIIIHLYLSSKWENYEKDNKHFYERAESYNDIDKCNEELNRLKQDKEFIRKSSQVCMALGIICAIIDIIIVIINQTK